MTPVKKHMVYTFLGVYAVCAAVLLILVASGKSDGIVIGTLVVQTVILLGAAIKTKDFFEDSESIPKLQKEQADAIAQLEKRYLDQLNTKDRQLDAKDAQLDAKDAQLVSKEQEIVKLNERYQRAKNGTLTSQDIVADMLYTSQSRKPDSK